LDGVPGEVTVGQLRTTWQNIKKWSDDAAAGKNSAGRGHADSGKTKALIKTFTGGFGKALDKVEAAHKAKKDADTKKFADAALTIAETYKDGIEDAKEEIKSESYAAFIVVINGLIAKLKDLKTHGAAANVDF
jgi:hypothetical protein